MGSKMKFLKMPIHGVGVKVFMIFHKCLHKLGSNITHMVQTNRCIDNQKKLNVLNHWVKLSFILGKVVPNDTIQGNCYPFSSLFHMQLHHARLQTSCNYYFFFCNCLCKDTQFIHYTTLQHFPFQKEVFSTFKKFGLGHKIYLDDNNNLDLCRKNVIIFKLPNGSCRCIENLLYYIQKFARDL